MCQVSSESIAVLYPEKKYGGPNFTSFRQGLRGQNTSVGIGITELTQPSDTLNYKPFFKHCILLAILHVCLYLCGINFFVLKTEQ